MDGLGDNCDTRVLIILSDYGELEHRSRMQICNGIEDKQLWFEASREFYATVML